MSSQLLSIAGWYILPNLVTGWIQTFYYRLTTRAGDPYPRQGQPAFARDRRNIFVLVVASYLLYTIYEADWQLRLQGHFYNELGVPVDVDSRSVQSRFRRLTVQYHPDKLDNPTPEERARTEAFFIHLKAAKDTLVDPAKRFAYDRFGPDMLEWKHCSTVMDYVQTGAMRMIPYYGGSLLSVLFLSFTRYIEFGRYWQYLTIFALCAFEFHTVTRPEFPAVARNLINPIFNLFGSHAPYLPFQTIVLARKIAISIFIALAQIAPQFRQPGGSSDPAQNLQNQAGQIMAITQAVDQDAKRLIALDLAPYREAGKEEGEMEKRLKSQLQVWLAANEVKNDAGVKAAIQRAVQRRNQEPAEQ